MNKNTIPTESELIAKHRKQLQHGVYKLEKGYSYFGKHYRFLVHLVRNHSVVDIALVHKRLNLGWSLEHAISTPQGFDPEDNSELLIATLWLTKKYTISQIATLRNVSMSRVRHILERCIRVKRFQRATTLL